MLQRPIGAFILFTISLLHPVAGFSEPQQFPATQPSASSSQNGGSQSVSQHGGSQSGSNQSGSDELGRKSDRMFGVLPNNGTVEGATKILPISNKEMFKIAAQDSFDPYVFPFVYAASRAFVTRTRSGRPQFNFAEIGGNGVGALISNLYYPAISGRTSGVESTGPPAIAEKHACDPDQGRYCCTHTGDDAQGRVEQFGLRGKEERQRAPQQNHERPAHAVPRAR